MVHVSQNTRPGLLMLSLLVGLLQQQLHKCSSAEHRGLAADSRQLLHVHLTQLLGRVIKDVLQQGCPT